MKFQKVLLLATLTIGTIISKNVDYPYTTDDIIYNFNCLEDNKNICKFLKKELFEAVSSISEILDLEIPVKFEAFVDDLSKYRIDTSKEVIAVVLDKEFIPLITKDTNIVSPYPNSELILKNINKENESDFYVVLNNFKSEKNYSTREDFDSSMVMEIFEELKTLNLVGYPYVNASNPDKDEFLYENYLPKRKDLKKMDATAAWNVEHCHEIVDGDLSHKTVHWEDTLISKESISKKLRRAVQKFVKCSVKYNLKREEKDNELNRIIALGDIHGDYEYFINILQHANLIDEENNWIGTDTILVQVGDIIDRGNDSFKIFDTIIKLREQAKEKGGIVYVLIGNHEMIELQGNHYYATTYDYELFGGVEGFEEAIGPAGKYGQFMRQEMNVTMVVDDSLFVHGSMPPEYLTEGVDKVNEHAREILLDTPSVEGINQLYLQNVIHPIITDPLFDLMNPLNPLWNREFANDPEDKMCSRLEEVLKLTNTKRVIIGHTVQPYGKIRTRCNNKIILIDIGISRCIGGGYFGYLEILKDKKEVWARYLGSN